MFNYEFKLIIADKESDYWKAIKELKDLWTEIIWDAEKENSAFFTWNNEIWERYLVMDWFSIDILVHELTHIVFHMLNDRWVPTRIETDEVFAYSIQDFFKQALTIFPK